MLLLLIIVGIALFVWFYRRSQQYQRRPGPPYPPRLASTRSMEAERFFDDSRSRDDRT